MKVFNFLTTGNEQRLLNVIFPPDYDITQFKLEDIKEFPKINVAAAKFCRLALVHSDTVVIDPTLRRKLDKKDQKKSDSPNWPTADCRYSLRLTDTESDILTKLSEKYTLSKTDAMVWCIRNFNAQLNTDPSLLSKVRAREEKLSLDDSRLFTVRLRSEQLEFYRKQADKGKVSLGRVIREIIEQDYRSHITNYTDVALPPLSNKYTPGRVIVNTETIEDDFDFDMEEED